MVKNIAIGAAALFGVAIASILGLAASKPDTFHIERTVTIQAKPEKIAGFINDFHQWTAWSPFEKMDPTMTRTFGGAASGKGATYGWSGDGHAGKGQMTITETSAEKVTISLDFTAPMEAHNVAEFTFVPKGDATDVTWGMSGPQPFVSKVMCVFVNMEAMVGPMFDDGLKRLKAAAEK